MRIIRKNSGMTFIEILLTASFVTFVMLAILNLMTGIYKGTVATTMKTNSYNIATEQLELLKHLGFGGLKVTPDSCISPSFDAPTLSLLDASCVLNEYPPFDKFQENTNYRVYSMVSYGEEDSDTGSIKAVPANLISSGGTFSNLKIIKVIVTYVINNQTRSSQITSILSNKDIMMSGIKISGMLQRKTTGGCPPNCPNPPGHRSNGGQVLVEGHPEYTSVILDETTGAYIIYNVLPGSYILYATFTSGLYLNSYYAGNPLVVSPTSGDMTNINILCDDLTPASITGFITFNNCAPLANATPETGVMVMCNDGQSSMTESTNTTGTNFLITGVNAGTTGGGQTMTVSFYQGSPGKTAGAFTWVGNVKKTNNPLNLGCIKLVPGTGNTGIKSFKTISAVDRTTPLSGITINLAPANNTLTPEPTPYAATSNGTGDITFTGLVPGTYLFTAAGSNYILEKAPLPDQHIFAGVNELKKIYLYPVGKISGTIRDAITSDPIPNIPVRAISNYGAGTMKAECLTNTLGAYLAERLPIGNDYMVRPYLDGTDYKCTIPDNGDYNCNYNNVAVIQGSTTVNKNFTLEIDTKDITGNLSMPSCDNRDVMIIAAPVSNTQTPHSFRKDLTGFYNEQNTLVRMKYPYYTTMANQNGNYLISVPASTNVDLYVYYNYISTTGSPDKPTRTMVKYYKKIPAVVPGSTQDITGSWTAY